MNYSQAIDSLRFKRNGSPTPYGSSHRQGLQLITSGWAFWRGIATPGYIRDQVNALLADAQSLDASIANEVASRGEIGVKTSPFFIFSQSTMLPLAQSIASFAADHQSFTSNLWGSVLDTVNEYRDKLVSVHDAAIALGFTLSGAPTPKGRTDFGDPTLGNLAERTIVSPAQAIFGVLKTVLYIALFAAIGIALVYVIRH